MRTNTFITIIIINIVREFMNVVTINGRDEKVGVCFGGNVRRVFIIFFSCFLNSCRDHWKLLSHLQSAVVIFE